ncbi:hypothetical protein V6N12_052202 [Hibiscus sabdariffa]|uniref:KIB1-4 beta-propeller domain-containing protein n=1 Tax=Hibiscus sabdariffa TaxID=183260 RepID=A0ABR2GHJ9_9ROSI
MVSKVSFGAVSRHWHSVFNAFLDHKRRSSRNPVPLLLILSSEESIIYSLQTKSKVSEIEFPKSCTWRCYGSCYDWLVTVDERLIITLSNPFKKVSSISLPHFDVLSIVNYRYQIVKVVLSDDPLLHPDDYLVVIIYNPHNRLAILKSGQKYWTHIETGEVGFTDVIFHKSLVYAIGQWNSFGFIDVSGLRSGETSWSPKFKLLVPDNRYTRSYLVESSMGNLYCIQRSVRNYDLLNSRGMIYFEGPRCINDPEVLSEVGTPCFTKRFRVFKLVLDDENGELLEKKEVNHMDGDIVFVGNNGTLAVSALDFPEGQPDSIYFTDDNFTDEVQYEPFGPQDNGIFHLKHINFEKYYQFKSSDKDHPPYIWILAPDHFKLTLSN